MEDLRTFPCPWKQDKGVLRLFGMVREVRYWTDHILETDCCLFRNISVRDPRQNLDNYLILGCLQRVTLREHEKYLWGITGLPFCNPTNQTREGGIFASLLWMIGKQKSQEARKNTWILADT